MKIAFFGTGEFSKNILEWVIADSRVDIVLVVSQADKLVWRKRILQKTHTKILAEQNNIEVLQPEKLLKNSDFLDYLDSLNLDFILVVAYGKIVPMRVLKAAKYGCINLHGSILPKYRGASPIQESIKNGDTKTWLTVMFMSKGMDEWDILKIQEVDIEKDDCSQDIFDKFEKFWAKLAVDTLEKIVNWDIEWKKQDNSKVTYCWKISKTDWEINFKLETSSEIYNKYRAYKAWPWIYCYYNNVKLNIESCEIFDKYLWDKNAKKTQKHIGIVCLDKNILVLKQVKLAWKKSMDILSFINGNKEFLDYKF